MANYHTTERIAEQDEATDQRDGDDEVGDEDEQDLTMVTAEVSGAPSAAAGRASRGARSPKRAKSGGTRSRSRGRSSRGRSRARRG
ncbi:hypothetical protein C4552_04445 [Candidatus Parcubacteria bacterium]|nr:MAG: hypothetical protein C4552_04445 [Candidatus Parcubacteria bacterium]